MKSIKFCVLVLIPNLILAVCGLSAAIAQTATVTRDDGGLKVVQNLLDQQIFVSSKLEFFTDDGRIVRVEIAGRHLEDISLSLSDLNLSLPDLNGYEDRFLIINSPYLFRNRSTECLDLIFDFLDNGGEEGETKAEATFSICGDREIITKFYVDGELVSVSSMQHFEFMNCDNISEAHSNRD